MFIVHNRKFRQTKKERMYVTYDERAPPPFAESIQPIVIRCGGLAEDAPTNHLTGAVVSNMCLFLCVFMFLFSPT